MIFKAFIIREDGVELTHYYDNVEHVMFYYDKEVKAECAEISIAGNKENTVIAINKEAFLYDVNGKIIKQIIAKTPL